MAANQLNHLIETSMRRISLQRVATRFLAASSTPRFAQLYNAQQSLASSRRWFSSSNAQQRTSRSADAEPQILSSPAAASAQSLKPEDFDISPPLLAAIKNKFNITEFFPIQAECFTPVVQNRDVIGQSKTGTGKTLAFLLPLAEKLHREKIMARTGEMSVLIMEPTRELAVQVSNEIHKLAPGLRVATVYGGAGMAKQQNDLLRGVDICVATPGRLQDLLDRGVCTMRATRSIVLDEADEMLRRGFREQIDKILSEQLQNGKNRQMLLFSATMPQWVKEISEIHQSEPVTINTINENDNVTPLNLLHQAMIAPSFITDRVEMIGELVSQVKGRVILFVNSKSEADMLCQSSFSNRLRADAAALHGDVSQRNRDAIMADFKAGKFKLLIATDVAARGLDIPNVALVIQNGAPRDTAFYVHRSGRTARAGKDGRSVLIYKSGDRDDIAALGRETGVKFSFAASPRIEGKSLSALTGEVGFVTIETRGPKSSQLQVDEVAQVISELTQVQNIRVGKSEFVNDGILVDIPQDAADKLIGALQAGQTSRIPLAVTESLPEEILGSKRQFAGFSLGGRGGGGGGGNNRGQSRNSGPSYKNNFSNRSNNNSSNQRGERNESAVQRWGSGSRDYADRAPRYGGRGGDSRDSRGSFSSGRSSRGDSFRKDFDPNSGY